MKEDDIVRWMKENSRVVLKLKDREIVIDLRIQSDDEFDYVVSTKGKVNILDIAMLKKITEDVLEEALTYFKGDKNE